MHTIQKRGEGSFQDDRYLWRLARKQPKLEKEDRKLQMRCPQEKKIELIDFLSCLTKLRKFYGSLKN